jgi:lysophospholipase L1-like esterase
MNVWSQIAISNATDLQKIGNDESFPLSGSYYLTEDIDLSGVANWIPIGAKSVTDAAPTAFTGVLDGGGFTIGNLKITGTTILKGLFGTLTHATVKNLTLEVNISSTNAQVGGVTGSMEGETRIERVTVKGSITGTENVGGITGRVQSSTAYPLDNVIRNCHVNATVKSTGAQAGGIAGRSNGSLLVEKVFVAGKIEAATTAVGQNAAGIVSYITWNLVKLVSSVVAVDEIKGSTPNLFYSRENRLEYFEDLYARNDINLQYHTATNRGTGLEIVTGKMLLAPDRFKSQSFYVDTLRWDFNNIWTLGNDGYPELRKTTDAEVINDKGKKKVACIGNSITENVSLAYYDKYPSRLQELLGWDEYAVRNYGASGTCMLKNGANPYWNIGRFTAALNWKPDILVIKLGTNDTSDDNWPKVSNFESDYVDFINTFKAVNPDVEIYVCHPIPTPGNTDKDAKVKELGDIIETIAEEQEVTYVDLYTPLEGKGSYYIADEALHPNMNGAKIMANTLYRAIAGIDDEQQVVYVSPTGTGDGKSWETAADFSWAAHNVGNSQMWLKEGTYSLTASVNFEGLFIYGGFSGNETELSERNWHVHPAILDGNNRISPFRNRTTTTGDPIPCLLDGVIVQNGLSPSAENGGGILANNGAVLRNCIFRNNQTSSGRNGAAVHCHVGTTLIENCLFVNNTSLGNGGAIQIGGNAKAIMINCTMANNKSTGLGGAIGTGATNSDCTLINTIAWNNYNGSAYNSYAMNGNINSGGTITSIHSAIESASTKFTDGDDVNHTVLSRDNTPGFAAASTIIGKATSTSDEETAAAASYALTAGSVCIDAGKSDEAAHLLLDLAGNSRLRGAQIDLGAYEFRWEIIVEPDATVDISTHTGYPGDIIFRSNDTGTGQLSGAATFTPLGKVKLVKTFTTNQWYPIGFPFEIDNDDITIKYGTTAVVSGVIYNGDTDEHDFTNSASKDCNFFVKKYNATSNRFIFDNTIVADTGYIVEFPAGEFDNAETVEVTFVSESSPEISIGATGASIPSANSNLSLVVNSNVSNITGIGGAMDYYQYNYSASDPRFTRIGSGSTVTLSTPLKPFEAIIAVKTDTPAGDFRSSIGDGSGGFTSLETLPGVEEPLEVRYYTLQGIYIHSPENDGVYIVKKVYDSGKTDVSKIVYKNKGI